MFTHAAGDGAALLGGPHHGPRQGAHPPSPRSALLAARTPLLTHRNQVPSILEYVYSGLEHDISDAPSFEVRIRPVSALCASDIGQEYKKLKRIMKIMVRFYKKVRAPRLSPERIP